MTIFDYCFEFLVSLIGATRAETTLGQIFVTYGSYILVVCVFVLMVKLLFGLFRLFCKFAGV